MEKSCFYNESLLDNFSEDIIKDWDSLKKNLSIRMINKRAVDKYEEGIIVQPFLDLYITFIIKEIDNDKIKNHMITVEDLSRYKVNKAEVIETAKNNIVNDRGRRLLSYKEHELFNNPLYPILSIPDNAMLMGETVKDSIKFLIQDVDEYNQNNILIVTNKRLFGANNLISSQMLSRVADKFNDSFYILPISIHQLFCIKEKYASRNASKESYEVEDDLLNMLEYYNDKVNKNWEDILSYNIYYYDKYDGNKLIVIN